MKQFRKNVVMAVIVAASMMGFFDLPVKAQTPRLRERSSPAFPAIELIVKESTGRAAVDRLGTRLPEVADWYGKTAQQLRNELLSDRRMRLDGKGRIFFVEEIDGQLAATTPPSTQEVVPGGELAPLDQSFVLHSKRGSQKTIYLNFVGATLTNTAWNWIFNRAQIIAPPFDLDGDLNAFSDAELERIQYIWQRVAEDYAPFDVDVTTEAPPPEQISRANSNDQVYGTTALITQRAGLYDSCGCGGVAFLRQFNNTTDQGKPALLFYDVLRGEEKGIAEAISHEIGHNVGLSHDGTSLTGYYRGHGSDLVVGWAPLMGVGYYKPLTQFSKGEYADANNKEDDFAVAQLWGLPLRQDDYGSSIAQATYFEGTTESGLTTGRMAGDIETSVDRDVFAIAAGSGTMTASVLPSMRSPNVDLELTLLDSSGNVIASSNPINELNAELSYTSSGDAMYYLEVRGTGQGDPLTKGYSSYGSVGLYNLDASFVAAGSAVPNALMTATPSSGASPLAVQFDATGSTDDGAVVSYYWDFGDGTGDLTGTNAAPLKTYSNPGNFKARLTIVDDMGLIASTSTAISVTATSPEVKMVSADTIVMSSNSTGSNLIQANALVTVVNQDGKPMPNSKVKVRWSGMSKAAAYGITGPDGKVYLSSPHMRGRGCERVTVMNIKMAGYAFDKSHTQSGVICGFEMKR